MDEVIKAICGLCDKPVDLLPEHIAVSGSKGWFHKQCTEKEGRRRALDRIKDQSHGG